jgi:hypothetical protein
MLTIISAPFAKKVGRSNRKYVQAKCDCGHIGSYLQYDVMRGHSFRCGPCSTRVGAKKITKHGESSRNHTTVEFKIWARMLYRCINKKNPAYEAYGGRGITVCESWQSYENFLADMGRRPSPAYSIDRIDVNKGYFKENCRWATAMTQANNRRSNVFWEINGQLKTIAEWCQLYGIKQSTVYARVKRGWNQMDALKKPINPNPTLKQRMKER